AKVLNTIGEIAHNSVHTWAAHNFAHVYISLCSIAMCQYQRACIALLPDLEVVAPSGSSSTFSDFLTRNTLALQVLLDKHGRCVHILPFEFDTESIIAQREREKKRCTAACQWIEYPEAFGRVGAILACKESTIEQDASKELISLALIAACLGH